MSQKALTKISNVSTGQTNCFHQR